MAAGKDAKRQLHQELFEKWLNVLYKSGKTSLLDSEEYDEIKRSLNGASKPSKLLQRKIKRNKYQLVDSVGLGLDQVICVASKESTGVSL